MEQEETVWQDLAQARGWMATDAEGMNFFTASCCTCLAASC